MTLGETDSCEISRQKFLGPWPLQSEFENIARSSQDWVSFSCDPLPSFQRMLPLWEWPCTSWSTHSVLWRWTVLNQPTQSVFLLCHVLEFSRLAKCFTMLVYIDARCSSQICTCMYSFYPLDNLWDRYYYCSHFVDEEMERSRDWLKVTSWGGTEAQSGPESLAPALGLFLTPLLPL